MSRLIDADALLYVLETVPLTDDGGVDINDLDDIIERQPTIEPPTTTWLGNYCPYRCQHCGKHTDSKTPYCAWCGRRASNYE